MNRLIRVMWNNRGYTDEWLNGIERSDFALPYGTDDVCAVLERYHESGKRIVLLTDFDCDGVMTGVVGFAGLSELGFNVSLFIPSSSGYGIHSYDAERLLEEYPDVACVLTGDVGITDYDSIAFFADRGLEVLVTDHHMPGNMGMLKASAVMNPMLDSDDGDHFREICGAAVMYTLLYRYAELYSSDCGYSCRQIERLRVFAGIGTMSDEMPVLYGNRQLVRDAVSICRLVYSGGKRDVCDGIPGCDIYRRAFRGLFFLLKAFADNGKFDDSGSSHEDFFSFYVAPLINTLKRMGRDMKTAYDIFFGSEQQSETCIWELMRLNEIRRAEVADAFDRMMDSYQKWAPYIYVTDVSGGYCGLLANKVLERTGEPVLVVREHDGVYSGSGRCPQWFGFITQMKDVSYVHPAGHECAFGVTLDGARSCDDYVTAVRPRIRQAKISAGADREVCPDCVISSVSEECDAGIDIPLFIDYLSEIDSCRPFGTGFPEPDMKLEFDPRTAKWSVMGKSGEHLKAVLPKGLTLVCFNQAASLFPGGIDVSMMPEKISARGRLQMNVWNNVSTVQFVGTLDPAIRQEPPLSDMWTDEADLMLMGGLS